jgi:hypothetical protein
MKVYPDMVRVNNAYDADCPCAVRDFLRQQAGKGKRCSYRS